MELGQPTFTTFLVILIRLIVVQALSSGSVLLRLTPYGERIFPSLFAEFTDMDVLARQQVGAFMDYLRENKLTFTNWLIHPLPLCSFGGAGLLI